MKQILNNGKKNGLALNYLTYSPLLSFVSPLNEGRVELLRREPGNREWESNHY